MIESCDFKVLVIDGCVDERKERELGNKGVG